MKSVMYSSQLFEKLSYDDRLLTAKELAKILALSVHTIRKWKWQERIPYVKVGGRSVRYHLETVRSWLATTNGGTANG